MTEAYPLHWPEGWPRTSANKRLWSLAGGRRHSQAWALVVDRLLGELGRIGAKQVVLSTNQPLRRDGLPYATTRGFEDPGAAVYFTLNRQQLVMAQDRYELLADNIRSLALAIEGMRQMQRHGGGHMMERAFAGFAALPPPSATNGRPWTEVLGLSATASRDEIEKAYRSRAKTAHPDHGGSTEAMATLNVAYDEAHEAMNNMTHACHWPGCGRAVPPRMWGCREHWFRLPRELRDRIWSAYRPGQETDKNPSAEYLQAAGAVQQWIGAHR